jgi:hypothetical protein
LPSKIGWGSWHLEKSVEAADPHRAIGHTRTNFRDTLSYCVGRAGWIWSRGAPGWSRRCTPTEILAGLVEGVTFHNEENGFCVLRVKIRGQRRAGRARPSSQGIRRSRKSTAAASSATIAWLAVVG